jgi:hypothetical protein
LNELQVRKIAPASHRKVLDAAKVSDAAKNVKIDKAAKVSSHDDSESPPPTRQPVKIDLRRKRHANSAVKSVKEENVKESPKDASTPPINSGQTFQFYEFSLCCCSHETTQDDVDITEC